MLFATKLPAAEKKKPKKFWNHFREYVVEFCKTTTIHGFNHMVAPRRHWLEVLFWTLILIGAIALTVGIITRSYSRYRQDPTVISIEKDFRKWIVSIPGSTACFLDKLDETKAEEVIKRKWNPENDNKFQYYMDFLRVLSNSSYNNLKDFERFSNDSSIKSAEFGELMKEINYAFDPTTLTLFNYLIPPDYHETLTEMGICYSFNSFITSYLKPGGKLYNTIETSETNHTHAKPPTCDYFTMPCPAKVLGFSRSVHFYVHSPYELPDSTSKHWLATNVYDIETSFTFLPIKFTREVRNLRLNQRKCRFRHESHVPESPYYTFKLCRMDCRRKLSMELCNCVPHFYVKRADQRQCNLKGLSCLSKHSDYIVKLVDEHKNQKYSCPCMPSCSETEYIFDAQSKLFQMQAKKKFSYRWAIEKFSKMTLRRDIIFGIEDLLVSLGGTAAFFLGCSLMSGVEIIYFFTLRMLRYFINVYKKKESNKQDGVKDFQRTNFSAWSSGKKRKRFMLINKDLVLLSANNFSGK